MSKEITTLDLGDRLSKVAKKSKSKFHKIKGESSKSENTVVSIESSEAAANDENRLS